MTIRIEHMSATESVMEGVLVAVPLCFQTQSAPPPGGETSINVMLQGADGWTLWLGTSGTRARVMSAAIHGTSGAVRDAGEIPGATSVVGLLHDPSAKGVDEPNLWAVASGPAGSALWKVEAAMRMNLIQEWGWLRPQKPRKIAEIFPGIAVTHAIAAGGGKTLAGTAADGRVFALDAATGEVRLMGKVAGPLGAFSRVALDADGRLWGADAAGRLWTCDLTSGNVETTDLAIPTSGPERPRTVTWALDPATGLLYGGVDPDAMLFSLDPKLRRLTTIGKVSRLDGLGCITVSHDGRVFGSAGLEEDVGHLFELDPAREALRNIGVATSALNARQYGYHFRSALTGAGGEIYFGQFERVNHLWVYFPATPAAAKA